MNSEKNTIENSREICGDYFKFIRSRRSGLYLKDLIDKFNFDDYWCFKTTNVQKLINYQEFLDFRYSGYTFFRKDLYHVNRILEWINWNSVNVNRIQYLNCPTPPFPPQKIIIRK